MYQLGDLSKPAKLYVIDSTRRTWRTLWLRKKETKRLIFAGYIDSISRSWNMSEPDGVRVELSDAMSRLRRQMHYTTFTGPAEPPEPDPILVKEYRPS